MKIPMPGLAACLCVLAGCSGSAPIRYYTLVPPPSAAAPVPDHASVDILPVTVPAAADYPQLVVREGAQRVQLVEDQQWIAPLPQEIRNALLARLSPVAVPAGIGDLKLSVEVTRFESVPGSYALLEAQWQLRANRPLICSGRFSEAVGPGFEALVAGHQRALQALADQIAGAVRNYKNSGPQSCPAAM